MLGRRNPQRSLFEAPTWPHAIPSEPFYARLGAVNEIPFFAMKTCRDVLSGQGAA